MMNNEMMRQLQARIQKMQEDLASQSVEASAGGGAVTVTISEIGMGPAQARVQRVKISPEAVDPEEAPRNAVRMSEVRSQKSDEVSSNVLPRWRCFEQRPSDF